MKYISTRAGCPSVSFEEALFNGLAPDGGLYMPQEIPRLPERFLDDLANKSLVEIADAVAAPFIDGLEPDERRSLVEDALDFEIPLVELDSGLFLLELFHGPTLAFKDVGARFMARLMARSVRRRPRDLTVLAATSGDTGGAVAQAFHGLEGIQVAILYPRGKVSTLQEKQFTTLGDNVRAYAVAGDFDDCQRLVKEAFGVPTLRAELGLTSANSINVARLLPQMFYYFHAAAQLSEGGQPPVFSVPSGNFGNLTAGLMARFMGLSARGFVASTNVNDTVPRYLDSGRFEPRPSVPTISNAIDVGDPSNFRRILWLFDGDLERIRSAVAGRRFSDEETREAIREVDSERDYVLDPHSAVGYLGLRRWQDETGVEAPGVVLATAHPAKFRDQIESILGRSVELPERLAKCLDQQSRAVGIGPTLEELSAALRS